MTRAALDQPDATAIREWAREAHRLSLAWGIAMTKGLPEPAGQRAAMVLNEVRAYAAFLFRDRVRKRLGPSWAQSLDTAIRNGRQDHELALLYSEYVGNLPPSTREDQALLTPERTYELVRAVRRDVAHRQPFVLTPEMVQHFCQVTGVHPDSLIGSGTGLASLAFYVVVFSLLTSEGDPTRWQMNQLLKKLKACREDLSARVDTLVPDDRAPGPSTLPASRRLIHDPTACLPPSAREKGVNRVGKDEVSQENQGS